MLESTHSFGSGFDLESNDTEYLDALKADVAYANAKGIEVGGYDLIALTRLDFRSLEVLRSAGCAMKHHLGPYFNDVRTCLGEGSPKSGRSKEGWYIGTKCGQLI